MFMLSMISAMYSCFRKLSNKPVFSLGKNIVDAQNAQNVKHERVYLLRLKKFSRHLSTTQDKKLYKK